MICSSVPAEIERTNTASGKRAVKARDVDAARQRGVEGAARQRGDDDEGAAPAHRRGEAADVPVAAFLLEEESDARVPSADAASAEACVDDLWSKFASVE